jgi:Cu-Zn family superoxide dismutase
MEHRSGMPHCFFLRGEASSKTAENPHGSERMQRISTMSGFAGLVLVALAGSASAQTATAPLKDAKGADVGSVVLTQTPTGVLMKVAIKGLPAGEHAFHVHAVGKCEAPFTSAGPHFNPGNHKHGLMAGEGHAGDMPNLYVAQDGTLTAEILNTAVSLDKSKPNSLFDADGSAVVVHAGVDDYKSDPAGNAGDRIACGVVSAGN